MKPPRLTLIPKLVRAAASLVLLLGFQLDLAASDAPPVAIPRSSQHILQSKTNGTAYQIDIAWPSGPTPEQGWPILYLLDGNRSFSSAVGLVRSLSRNPKGSGVSPGIVVGIGYPTQDESFIGKARTRDYTPAPDGAERFLLFIETELKPFLADRLPIDPRRQTLHGHSYGGLFVLHALFTRPTSFQTYLVSSPSIWWNEKAILEAEPRFLETLSSDTPSPTIRITSAQYEQELDPRLTDTPGAQDRLSLLTQRAMVDNARQLAQRLRESGLDCHYRNFARANHGNAAAYSLIEGLPIIFPAPVPPAALKDDEGLRHSGSRNRS